MTAAFTYSFQSEWIKKKRTLASWLVIIGGFFTPAIVIVARLINHSKLKEAYLATDYWERHWRNSWESMAMFLLPVGVIMATSLITQIEYKNNTWKQVHTAPLSLTVLFFSKLLVVVVMIVQFFILFNAGIYASVIIPFWLVKGVPYPPEPINYFYFLKENAFYFIDCLPIIALQYLLGLRFKNFLVSIGAGFLLWVASLGSLIWKYGYVLPYTYCMYNYLKGETISKAASPAVNIHWMALLYASFFLAAGYVLYVTQKEKG
ncbi:MAG: hypothetical protein OJF59_000561 [Cytophagales bacterium]|jgi:hypothetical protein|nr:ABC transporter permease [Bacteroidota bacterium]MBS1981378.1 ABC transporter permease [Bacteroidota bacterium]WHZ06808.1 MAG: hypothetical protein OJF59_000561 [Cytophagales bacterium]